MTGVWKWLGQIITGQQIKSTKVASNNSTIEYNILYLTSKPRCMEIKMSCLLIQFLTRNYQSFICIRMMRSELIKSKLFDQYMKK